MSLKSITELSIKGLYVIEPDKEDNNGEYCIETYNSLDFIKANLNMKFVQENQSFSYKGVLRGLHFNKNHPQGKLVRVISGEIYDVAVDMRKESETYLKWTGVNLSSDNCKQLYIPEGFAHGFLVMSDTATVCFKVTDYWIKDDEIGIRWDDPYLNIKWPFEKGQIPIVAYKDTIYPDISI